MDLSIAWFEQILALHRVLSGPHGVAIAKKKELVPNWQIYPRDCAIDHAPFHLGVV